MNLNKFETNYKKKKNKFETILISKFKFEFKPKKLIRPEFEFEYMCSTLM